MSDLDISPPSRRDQKIVDSSMTQDSTGATQEASSSSGRISRFSIERHPDHAATQRSRATIRKTAEPICSPPAKAMMMEHMAIDLQMLEVDKALDVIELRQSSVNSHMADTDQALDELEDLIKGLES